MDGTVDDVVESHPRGTLVGLNWLERQSEEEDRNRWRETI